MRRGEGKCEAGSQEKKGPDEDTNKPIYNFRIQSMEKGLGIREGSRVRTERVNRS